MPTNPIEGPQQDKLQSFETKATGIMGILTSIFGFFQMFRAMKAQNAAPVPTPSPVMSADQGKAATIARAELQKSRPDANTATVMAVNPIPNQPQSYQVLFMIPPNQSLWAIVDITQGTVTQSNFK